MTRYVEFEGRTLTIHDREDWQDPKLPVHSTNGFEWDTDTEAVHYTAAVDLPDGDPDELVPGRPDWWLVPSYLRRIQADYQLNRGYAIGYNWPIDYLGGIWEARGWDYECAANVGWNPRTYAILLLVDGNDAPNEWMLRSCRYLHHQAFLRSGREHMIRPHSQLGWNEKTNTQILYPFPGFQTACPGVGGRSKMIVPSGLQGGEYNWRYHTSAPTPEPEPTEGEAEMFTLVCKGTDSAHHPVIVTISGHKVGMTGLNIASDATAIAKANGQTEVVTISNVLWEDWLKKAMQDRPA